MLDYRTTISSIDQYNRNITTAKSRIELTSIQLENVCGLLREAKEIAIEQSAIDDQAGRENAVQQITYIYDSIFATANDKYGDAYLFAGHKTSTEPFAKDADYEATYNGDSGEINIIVGEGAQVKINVTGNEVFTGVDVTSGTNIFDDLKALKDALEAEPYNSTEVSDLVGNFVKGVDQVEGAVIKQSITYKRLESTEKHWDRFKLNIEDMLSKTEDADLAKAIVELQAQKTAYEVTLAAGAGMFDKSLINFLR